MPTKSRNSAAIWLILILVAMIGLMPDSQAEEYRTELLSNRLSVILPMKPDIEPRSASIMGAEQPNEIETRVVCEDGDKKMVVMAWELFKRAGADYSTEAPKYINEWFESQNIPTEPWENKPDAVGALANLPKGNDEAMLYGACLHRHKDGTVQLVGVFFNKKLNEDPAACLKTTRNVLSSIQSEERTLPLGKPQRFNLRQENTLIVTLPPEWACATQKGIDFDVHHLYEVKDLGKSTRHCGIYYGDHPALHHERLKIEPKLVRKKKSSVLKSEREWYLYPSNNEVPGFACETMVRVRQQLGGGMLHFFGSASDAAGTDGIIEMLITVEIENPNKRRSRKK